MRRFECIAPRWRRMASTLLLMALAAAAPVARAACQLAHAEMPVRIIDGRPIATLKLNGTEVPLLVDSGAFISILSATAAQQLKLGTTPMPPGWRIQGATGRIDVRLTRVGKVGLLGTELSDVEFLVGGNELNAGARGVIGRNLLALGDTEYDLAHGVVRLSFPRGDCDKTNLAYWAGSAPVIVLPLESRGDHEDSEIRIAVGINGNRAVALMDTGAAATSLTLQAALRAGIEERDMVLVGRSGGHGAGRSNVWLGTVKLLEIGGEKVSNTEVAIRDNDEREMTLGLDYFLSHRIYASRLQRQVYITWNGGPVFAKSRVKPGDYDTRFAAVPNDVDKDDADALARRGGAALAAGNHARALDDLNRACELAPGVADNFFARARVHLAMRQPRLALADLDQALRIDPSLAEVRLRRAWVRESLADRAGAQADLAHLDGSLPSSAPLRAGMGELYSRFPQPAEALRQLDLWVGTHPRDAHLAAMLGMRCWTRTRANIELPIALKDCKDAIDADGGDAGLRGMLGWTYLRLDDAVRAKGTFDEAIRLKETAYPLYGRALAYLRLNDKSAAERDLAAARRLDPKIDEYVLSDGFEFAESVARQKAAGS